MDVRQQEGRAQVIEVCRKIESGDDIAWEMLKEVPCDLQRQMLQALNMDSNLGGKVRHKLLMRTGQSMEKAWG